MAVCRLAAETPGAKLMRYRREDDDGDYTFGQGDDTWLINSPEAVAQAIKTRFELWYGQWFLDTTEGTPWIQSVLGNNARRFTTSPSGSASLKRRASAQSPHLIPQ
jgi:hypothetical protein